MNEHLTAALASRYRLEREIGAGGMATVYLAKDVRHERDVAVKVLRPEIASSIGVERFLAEIKTTAHLQHPHILGLIDSGEVNGTVFYVMPFVKGESLRERLNREVQMPVADAVRIATQVASALDYAHRHGVIHRDIKPENILLHDEQALVADFGIALAASRSQTSTRITEAGTSLGTPHYMSPEQAMGERTLDARADIYALGCVLYEMLTGEPPFDGPSAQAIIAKVMTAEPEPVTTVRKTVPTNVAAATMMAISKLPADRFPTASAFAAALENVQFSGPRATALLVPQGAFLVRRSVVFATAAAVLIAVGAAFVLIAKGASTSGTGAVTRFEIPLDAPPQAQVHLARDGSALIWSAGGAYWSRRFDSLGVKRLRDAPQTQGGIRDISPDGREALVGGGRGGGGLAVVPLAQGPVRELGVSGGGRGGGGAAWSDDGYLYVAFGGPPGAPRGIVRVRATGGIADTVVKLTGDRAIRELIAVPGGATLLAIEDTPGRNDTDTLVAFDANSGKRTPLTAGAQQVRYVAPGYVLYTASQNIMAARFDAKRRTMSEPVRLVETGAAVSSFAATRDVLIYRPAPDAQESAGIELRSTKGSASRLLPGIPENVLLSGFTVSPDGRRIAAYGAPTPAQGANTATPVVNIYIYELPSGPLQPLTSAKRDAFPAWMPGGRDISFVRFDTAGGRTTSTLMRRPWDGSGTEETIASQDSLLFGPASWLPRGDRAVVQIGGLQGGGRGRGPGGLAGTPGGRAGAPEGGRGGGGGQNSDLVIVSLPSKGPPVPLMKTDFPEASPAVSPDGRFIAYTSTSSGRGEVYVSPIDGSARRQVSRSGGGAPKWSRSGLDLFFRTNVGAAGADTLFKARIDVGADITVGEPEVVMTNVSFGGGYAILPGDTTIVTGPAASSARRPVIVVMNFARELERLLSAK